MAKRSPYPVREHTRLKDFDYATPGMYAVTLVVNNRLCLLGRITAMNLSPAGEMIRDKWMTIPGHHPGIQIDEFIVMPNHFHGIVVLEEVEPGRAAVSLSEVVQRFKGLTTALYGDGVRNHGWPQYERRFWQPGFFDRVIRTEEELRRQRRYIRGNVDLWERDAENPRLHGN